MKYGLYGSVASSQAIITENLSPCKTIGLISSCVVKERITLLSSGYEVKSFLLNLICSINGSDVFQSLRLKKLP